MIFKNMRSESWGKQVNLKEFMQKADEILKEMDLEELLNCLQNLARKTSKENRELFLQILNDSCRYNLQEIDRNRDIVYGRLMQDDEVKNKLDDIKTNFEKIKNGELCLYAEGYESYLEGYWESDWEWIYKDNDNIGNIIEEAVIFAHNCLNNFKYEEAAKIYELVMEISIIVEDEQGGDSFEFDLESMVSEDLTKVDLKTLALEVLYSNYQIQSIEQRASVLYSFFKYCYFENIHIEDILSIGREKLKDINEFFRFWIDFLMRQESHIASRLLKEGALYHNGIEGLVEVARMSYKLHPSAYLAALLEYEKICNYHEMKMLGIEALNKLDPDLCIRGKIAIKTAQACYFIEDDECMRKCWFEAFYSNSTITNYLRLYKDKKTIRQYVDKAKKRIEQLQISDGYYDKSYNSSFAIENIKNSVTQNEYKYLCFFIGQFDRIIDWFMEQKNPLGWSGKFISAGLDLMLLYLYAGISLDKAGRVIVDRIVNHIGFNKNKDFVFIEDNLDTANKNTNQSARQSIKQNDGQSDRQSDGQSDKKIFWNIFSIWKNNYMLPIDAKVVYVKKLEPIINKRVDAIVCGKFRRKYNDVAILATVLGEVKASLGIVSSKMDVVNYYLEKYPRHSAFRREMREYI